MVARMSVTELELAHVDAKIVLETAEHALGPLPEDLEANPHAPQQTGMIDPLDSSANWSFYSARCGPSDEYQDRNPRRGVLLATIAYMIPVGGAVLVLQATEATIASKGHLLLASFSAIRDASSWLGSIFSFFWFFEMAATGKLVGEGNWKAVGGHVVISTTVSLFCGILAMFCFLFLAEPILDFVSPREDVDAIKGIALHPARVASASLPFSVYIFAAAGLLLGAKQIAQTVGLFFVWGCGSAVGIVIALNRLDCRDEEFEFCPEDFKSGFSDLDDFVKDVSDCRRTYEDDGWVCSSYERFLANSAAVLSIASAGLAASLMCLHYRLIRPKKVNFSAALRTTHFLREWSRDTAWVAVRSVLGNSRHFAALAISLRMGLTESAAWILFGSVSQLSYAVPSNLSCIAMITIARLIGRKEYASATKVLNDYRLFGLACGVIFCAIAAAGKKQIIESYSKETEEEGLRGVVDPVWGWVLAYQPARSLLAVYQSLIAGRQAFSYWGKSTAICTVIVFIPCAAVAAHKGDVHILFIGEVLYTMLLAAMLYIKVHYWSKDELEGLDRKSVV